MFYLANQPAQYSSLDMLDLPITRADSMHNTPPLLLSELAQNSQAKVAAIVTTEQRSQILRRMGLIEGASVTLLERSHGNLLVRIDDSRIILSQRLAEAIHVEPY